MNDDVHYEINLGCDACGHPQFLHCEDDEDPCGCLAARRTGARSFEWTCKCAGFVRPPGARPEPETVVLDHGHEEKSA